MFDKGQVIEFKVEDVSDQGQGIGHPEGFTVFVNDALPGDTVLAKITKAKKRFAFASLVEVTEKSAERIENTCIYSGDCGGCIFTEYDYNAQLRLKKNQVEAKLMRLGGLENPPVKDTIGMDNPWEYRNKGVLQVSVDKESGEVSVGFNRVRTHDVIDCKVCRIQSKSVMVVAEVLRTYLSQNREAAEKTLSVTVKTAFGTGEVMVIINSKTKDYPWDAPDFQNFAEDLDDAVYESGFSLESIYLEYPKAKEPLLLAGKRTIDEINDDIKFEISPRSFYQVNPAMMKVLYDKAFEYAMPLDRAGTILDLYCGVGSIGLWILKKMELAGSEDMPFVLGIELEKQAILDANRNAVINGIVNARYLQGKSEDVLPSIVSERADEDNPILKKIDSDLVEKAKDSSVAIIDPPRSGCSPELLDALISTFVEKIVYVSCDPATLARDVKILGEGGYVVKEVTPVDMFPHTGHVECVCLLAKTSSKESNMCRIGISPAMCGFVPTI